MGANKTIPVFYSPAYARSAYSFETTRKAKWIAESLVRDPIPGIELIEPKPLTEAQVTAVHDPAYVRAVKTGRPRSIAESNGFPWDANLWDMVLASNGGTVEAALAALKYGVAGSLSSGLHHAHYDRGAGYCTFNGLVIAAREALAAGAKNVLILDLDAHYGDGTAELIADEPRIRQIDVTTGRLRDDYLLTIRRELVAADRPDLCLYNAGMDPYEGCSLGGHPGITRQVLAERERLMFDWFVSRKIPIAFVLAGGYTGDRLDKRGLVGLHRLTLSCAAEAGLSV